MRSTESSADADFSKFIGLFKLKTGIDLGLYKEAQMKRRLSNLRDRRGYRSFVEFYKEMEKDKNLLHEFLDHMTINVSEFYRNSQRWGVLEQRIIPELLGNSGSGRFKCWSAACSSGEEPYSLAILLSSFLKMKDIQLLATDIDQNVIDKAKQGRYPPNSVKDVPRPHLAKHFSVQDNQYVVSDELKKCVQFKKHNLLSDPFEQNFDLIVCRNVLIYFTDEAKEILFGKFSKALRKGGYFFIGGSEQIFQPQRYQLEPVDTFFYRKQ